MERRRPAGSAPTTKKRRRPTALVLLSMHTTAATLKCTELTGWRCVPRHCGEDETLAEAHRRHSATHVRQCARMCKQWPAFTLRQPAGCFCWASCGTFQSSNYWKGRAVTYLQHANQSLLSPNHSFLLHQRVRFPHVNNRRRKVGDRPMVDCSYLRQACVTLGRPQPRCSSRCPIRDRPFQIHVHGPHASDDVAIALEHMHGLQDPLNPFGPLRHLEQDVSVVIGQLPPEEPVETRAARMLWPKWEVGFSDVQLTTILPLGAALHQGTLGRERLMLSGALFPQSWEPLAAVTDGICTFERDDVLGDARVKGQPLPRCAKRECFARLGLCRPGHVFGRDAWLARQALDTALGFDDLRAESRSFYTTRQRLRVLFTIRRSSHGRDIANIPELLAACPSFRHRGWSIHCNAVPFATLSLRETIARVRAVDMLVCMNGGDCIHSMHLRAGRTLVEAINRGFEDNPDVGWRDLFRQRVEPTLRFKRIVVGALHAGRGGNLSDVTLRASRARRAWNQNNNLSWTSFSSVVRSVIDEDPCRLRVDCRHIQ